MALQKNLWVKKYLKRRGCGESFFRHRGSNEYSFLKSNTILSSKIIPWMENGNAFRGRGFTGIRTLFHPQILPRRLKKLVSSE
jgi:hypothetical protein